MTSETRLCPFCREEIKVGAIKCKHCGSSLAEPTPGEGAWFSPDGLLRIGAMVREYRVERLLGEGGMGAVYQATHQLTGHHVAVKVVAPELLRDDTVRRRFLEEARVMAELHHPGIVGLHNFFEEHGRLFLVMEFIEGQDLESLLVRGPLPTDQAVAVAVGILEALDYAASRPKPVIHRDIKPANILLSTDGRVLVTDFGVAKAVGREKLTRTRGVVGTFEYMSPEQVRGRPASPRSDLYSLGVTLYQMLAGRVPFPQKTDTGIDSMEGHLHEQPPSLTEFRSDLPEDLLEAVRVALAKEPGERFSSARAFIQALGGSEKKAATPVPPRRKVGTPTEALPPENLPPDPLAHTAAVPTPVEATVAPLDSLALSTEPTVASSPPERRGTPTMPLPPRETSAGSTPGAPPARGGGKTLGYFLGGLALSLVAVVVVLVVTGKLRFKEPEEPAQVQEAAATGQPDAGRQQDTKQVLHPADVRTVEVRAAKPDSREVKPETAPAPTPDVREVKPEVKAPPRTMKPVPATRISATASSVDKTVRTNLEWITYDPGNVLDGKSETAWSEGSRGSGVDEWLQLLFDKPIEVGRLRILNGYQKIRGDRVGDRFSVNERVKDLNIKTDAYELDVTLKDEREFQEIKLPGGPVRWVRLTIRSVYPARYPDTSLSEVQVWAFEESSPSAPAPPQPAAPGSPTARALKDQARELVVRWERSQQKRDRMAYMGCYCREMTGVKAVGKRQIPFEDRETWMADRLRFLPRMAAFMVTDLKLTSGTDSGRPQVTARFTQFFATNLYEDCGPKLLRIIREDGRACINREEMFESVPWSRYSGFVCPGITDVE